MYNRYVPSPDGTYERKVIGHTSGKPVPTVPDSVPQKEPAVQQTVRQVVKQKSVLPQLHLDTGDILVLLILLLVMTEGEESDPMGALITLAAFLLTQ